MAKKNKALAEAKEVIEKLQEQVHELGGEMEKMNALKEELLEWLGLDSVKSDIEKLEERVDELGEDNESNIRDVVEDLLGSASISI